MAGGRVGGRRRRASSVVPAGQERSLPAHRRPRPPRSAALPAATGAIAALLVGGAGLGFALIADAEADSGGAVQAQAADAPNLRPAPATPTPDLPATPSADVVSGPSPTDVAPPTVPVAQTESLRQPTAHPATPRSATGAP